MYLSDFEYFLRGIIISYDNIKFLGHKRKFLANFRENIYIFITPYSRI